MPLQTCVTTYFLFSIHLERYYKNFLGGNSILVSCRFYKDVKCIFGFTEK